MREYETMILVKPDLKSEQVEIFLDDIKKQITQNSGKVKEAKVWKNKEKLAYKIQHFSEGIYLLLFFEMNPAALKKLERYCNLNENILRFLFIKKNE